jgi:hypothetical protein
MKAAPNGMAQDDMSQYLAAVKAQYLGQARKFQDTSEVGLRIGNIDAAGDLWGNVLVSDPSKFNAAREGMAKTIQAQGLSEQKTASEIRRSEQNLATFAMNGQAISSPRQFLADAKSGKWNAVADPGRLAQAVSAASAQVKADEAEARRAYREQQVIARADTVDRVQDYVTSVRSNGGVPPMVGGQPLVTEGQVRKAFADDPIRAERLVQQMRTSQEIGHLSTVVKGTTMEEDQALIDSYAPKQGATFTGDDAEKLKAVQSFIDTKWKAAQAGVNADLKDFQGTEQEGVARKYDDWNQTAFTKGVPDEAQAAIYNAYGNSAKADELFGKLKQSAALGELQRQATSGTLDQDNALYQAAMSESAAGGTGSAYAAQQADLLKKVLDDKYKALHDSPASFVVGDSGPLKSKWDAFSKAQAAAQTAPGDAAAANAAAAAGRAASSATIAEQLRVGVPEYQAQAIPDPLAKQYANSLQNAQPEQRSAIAQEIVNLGPQALGQVVKAGAPSSVAVYAAVTDPIWTAKLSQAEKMTGTDQSGILKTRRIAPEQVSDAVTNAFAGLGGTLPPSSQPAYRDAISNVAIVNIGRGMSITDAVTDAMAPFTGGTNISGSLRIPSTYSQPDTEKGLQSVISGIALGTVPVKPIASGLPGSTPETDLQAIKQAARTGGLSWMTNENSTGAILVLPNGRYLETPDGKRFTVMFPDAEAKGRAVPRPSPMQNLGSQPSNAAAAEGGLQ